ncbi:hypothetical protein KC332_g12980 [Hortaea werneckii]|uniref:Uncharacterized protein n=1 Tax=Hortaea werneckii TaxID=91943 RepID=A0A3M7IX78_HORWE|nr:hypothetical protein KC329_g13204 [Hortaea werneckii]KAI7268764.1 hypothetical protein KC335_g6893 [Hortaea werneckii]KAI7393263.1 hypothetical protein KC332_g12980 [Hortaea werneckii]KAI7416531.1 hypothetical protein KC336_g10361 [Hortaea werneckii]KAI7438223.1 hypothetical protein KC368_g12156 [Hortaea werneckii]
MGGFLKGTNITLIHPLFPPKEAKDWTPEKITRWITQAHGQTSTKFLEGETTHIVCSEAVWHNKPVLIQAALAANEQAETGGSGRRPVKFVSPDWLRDALFAAHKPSSDGAYSWVKLAKAREAQEARTEKIVERAERELDRRSAGKGGGGAGAQQSMMAEVLQDATDPYLGEEDRTALERQAQMERKEEMRRKVQEGLDKQKEKEQAAIARKAAKKARNAVFSDDYHVYMDATGFKFDVCITKVDTKHNRNERYALTLKIYESNIAPQNYAVNAHFAGTGRLPSNNVLLAKGSNFGTAMRGFKKLFKEKTQVEWDDRIAFAVERAKRDRARREGNSANGGSVRGVSVPGDGAAFLAAFRALEEEDFAKRPFTYHPPLYGPRGVLPAKEKKVFPEIGPRIEEQARRKGAEDIELWMSGAEAFGPGPGDDQDDGAGGDFISGGSDWNTGFDHLMSGALDAAGDINGDGEAAPGNSGDSLTDIFDNPETGYPFGNAQDDGDDGNFNFDIEGPVAPVQDGDTTAAPPQNPTDPPSNSPPSPEKDTSPQPPSKEPTTQPPSTIAETETQSFNHTQAALAAQDQLKKLPNPPPDSSAQQPAPLNLGTSILGKRKIASESEDDGFSTEGPSGKKQQQEAVSADGERVNESGEENKATVLGASAAESEGGGDAEGGARAAGGEQAGREM